MMTPPKDPDTARLFGDASPGCGCHTCRRAARADGLEMFVKAAHAVCDALEARDVSGFYSAGMALCIARARARAEQDALEHAFDLPQITFCPVCREADPRHGLHCPRGDRPEPPYLPDPQEERPL